MKRNKTQYVKASKWSDKKYLVALERVAAAASNVVGPTGINVSMVKLLTRLETALDRVPICVKEAA